jgi:hypothetical protein
MHMFVRCLEAMSGVMFVLLLVFFTRNWKPSEE